MDSVDRRPATVAVDFPGQFPSAADDDILPRAVGRIAGRLPLAIKDSVDGARFRKWISVDRSPHMAREQLADVRPCDR